MTLNRTQMRVSFLALIAMAAAPIAMADTLHSNVSFQIVDQDADGQEVLAKRDTVRPGEMLHYTVTHKNGTEMDLSDLVVMAPIPQGGRFAPASDRSSLPAAFEIQAEMDPHNEGLEWSSMPATRIVLGADGAETIEPLPMTEIRAVRWTLEALEAGETALNSYRVVVN